MISRDPIIYKDEIIYFKTKLVELEFKEKHIIMLLNVLLLRKDKAVLGIPFLQKYSLKFD